MLKNEEQCEAVTRTNVEVEVTPKLIQGPMVVCEIDPGPGSGGKVKGGVIKLRRGADYQIVFELQDGDVPGLQFAQGGSNAFWCDINTCPTSAGNNSNGQLTNPTVDSTGRKLTVDATPTAQKNAVHYRLNFNNGCNFDPIIIHD